MKKHFLTGLIALMTLSLLGIVAVQFFWIRNAIQVKEQQFDQSVSKALTQIVQRLKKDRDVHYVSGFVLQDDHAYGYTYNDSIVWTNRNNASGDPIYVSRSPKVKSGSSVSVSTKGGSAILTVDAVHNDTFRYKTIVKLDSLKDELNSDQYFVMTELEDSLNLIVEKTLSQVREQRATVNEAIDEMVIELKSIDDPIDEIVSRDLLAKRTDQALKDEGILLPYEFGIYYPEKDSLSILSSANYTPGKNKLYKTRLFPESIFERPEALVISFPGQRAHILESMAWLLSGSVLFTAVILLTFFLTIRIILKQKKVSEIKSDFINNMTHEFKTPIATISLAVDSINNPKVIDQPEKIKYFTGVIDEENKRMNTRVENVLQMSLIESSDFSLQPELTDIHEILGQAARNVQLQVSKRQGILNLDLDAANPSIMADKTHLLGIFTNLLDNAVKYSAEAPDIRISTRDGQNVLEVRIADKGVGMSREQQNRIFDKFYRIPSGDIHNVKGFGLGLSYVKAIILSMKGDIEVKSQVDKGSTFILRFPRNT
jgi:two-component system phosphate regulon sensor histidine kinase PhoR